MSRCNFSKLTVPRERAGDDNPADGTEAFVAEFARGNNTATPVGKIHRHEISYWDAAIICAAREPGCHTLYSEDLNHGQEYHGVRVIDPFLQTGA